MVPLPVQQYRVGQARDWSGSVAAIAGFPLQSDAVRYAKQARIALNRLFLFFNESDNLGVVQSELQSKLLKLRQTFSTRPADTQAGSATTRWWE